VSVCVRVRVCVCVCVCVRAAEMLTHIWIRPHTPPGPKLWLILEIMPHTCTAPEMQ
jgi:hypothetical protein